MLSCSTASAAPRQDQNKLSDNRIPMFDVRTPPEILALNVLPSDPPTHLLFRSLGSRMVIIQAPKYQRCLQQLLDFGRGGQREATKTIIVELYYGVSDDAFRRGGARPLAKARLDNRIFGNGPPLFSRLNILVFCYAPHRSRGAPHPLQRRFICL